MIKQLLIKQNAIQGCFLFKQIMNMFLHGMYFA